MAQGLLLLVCHGAIAPYVKAEEAQGFIAEMETAQAERRLVTDAGAAHAITQRERGTDPSAGAADNAAADQRSWAELPAFSSEVFDRAMP